MSTHSAGLPRRRMNRQRDFRLAVAIAAVGVVVVLFVLRPKASPPAPVEAPAPVVVAPPAPPPAEPAPEVVTRATLTVPDSALVGSPVSVRWSGPDYPEDYVTLVPTDSADSVDGESYLTKSGRTLEFSAPEEVGRWEFRYVIGQSHRVLARAALVLRPRFAEIIAPRQAIMGTQVDVNWSGLSRPGDFLAVMNRGTSDAIIGDMTPIDRPAPVAVTIPMEPGEAEIRYLTKARKVIGRLPITITIPVTALFAPDEVAAGSTFEVRWNGPGNPADAVVLVVPGAGANGPRIRTPTAQGSPLRVVAPRQTGPAELRYVAGAKALVLSRRPIRIVPAR